MENKNTKREIVRKLLEKEIETKDEEELLDLLINQPLAVDVDKQEEEARSLGDKVADKMATVAGSWSFILLFLFFLVAWIVFNVVLLKEKPVDPYPFILLNLVLSCIAAIQAPIIMMSQNREAKKDRLRNQNDYKTDLKSELILEDLHKKMDTILNNQSRLLRLLEKDKTDQNK